MRNVGSGHPSDRWWRGDDHLHCMCPSRNQIRQFKPGQKRRSATKMVPQSCAHTPSPWTVVLSMDRSSRPCCGAATASLEPSWAACGALLGGPQERLKSLKLNTSTHIYIHLCGYIMSSSAQKPDIFYILQVQYAPPLRLAVSSRMFLSKPQNQTSHLAPDQGRQTAGGPAARL